MDILEIHECVMKQLIEQNSTQDLEIAHDFIKRRMELKPMTINEKSLCNNKLVELRLTMRKKKCTVDNYRKDAEHVLDLYRRKAPTKIYTSPTNGMYTRDNVRDFYIKQYIIVLKRHLSKTMLNKIAPLFSNKYKFNENIICPYCFFIVPSSNSTFYCKRCGAELTIVECGTSVDDQKRINMSKRYKYQEVKNFETCMKNVQGKQSTEVPQHVYEITLKTLENMEIEKSSLTLETTMLIFERNGLQDNYGDVFKVYHDISGKPLHDFSGVEDLLKRRYSEFVREYQIMKPNGRKSMPNTQLMLFLLLKSINFPCNEKDFFTIKTETKKEEHISLVLKIFKKKGWIKTKETKEMKVVGNVGWTA